MGPLENAKRGRVLVQNHGGSIRHLEIQDRN